MELILILILVIAVVWLIFRGLAKMRATKKAELDDAWRVVLSDPNYVRRRQHEESKRKV